MFDKMFNGTLPLQGTDVAAGWDRLYLFLVWISVLFFILVVGGMIYFAFKYRSRPGVKPKYIAGSHLLELVFITVPTLLLMVIFGWGYSVYHSMVVPPPNAYEIRVVAKQWLWQFQYDNGRVTIGDLFVPMNRPVKLVMTSQDVLHSFFVPNFRVKQDVVPGMYTSVWFEAKLPGKHQIFCTEYCGTSHSGMLGSVIALNEQQWQAWNSGKQIGPIPVAGKELTDAEITASKEAGGGATISLAAQGKALYQAKGCVACHSTDGSVKVGPSFKGIFGSKAELADGKTVVVDENYIRESIEKPQAKIVKGFQPVMPTFQGLFNETELNALIAYIKSLK